MRIASIFMEPLGLELIVLCANVLSMVVEKYSYMRLLGKSMSW